MQVNATSGLTASRMRFGLMGAQAKSLLNLAREAQAAKSNGQLLNVGEHTHRISTPNWADHVNNWLG